MKKILLPAIQATVTILLLWWIFRNPENNREMLAALQHSFTAGAWFWLLPGIASVGVASVLQTERWRWLLAAQGINMGWWRTFRVYMVGLFFNLFLLGATGGDVVKIYYAMRETASKKSAAFLSVLVDRMMGLVGLIAVTIVVVALRWEELTAHAVTRGLLGVLAFVMGGMFALIVFGFFVDRFNLSSKLPKWLPLHAKIVEFASAFSVYARDGKTLATTFLLSVICHIFNFLAFYFAARALGVFPGFSGMLDVFSVMPIIMVIAALPISLSGMGVREGLFEKMFSVMFETSKAISVPISLLGFFMVVFWGIIGGIIYFLYRPSGGIHLSDIQEEVQAVEDEIEDRR